MYNTIPGPSFHGAEGQPAQASTLTPTPMEELDGFRPR